MAHTVVMIRGVLHDVELLIKELSTRYLPYKSYNKKTKKMEKSMLQVRLCPIQLYDIIYPKDQRDVIHNHIFRGSKGSPFHKWLNKFIYPLRKMMRLKPIADYKTDKHLPMQFPKSLDIIAVGEKDDYWVEPDGTHVKEKDKSALATEGI